MSEPTQEQIREACKRIQESWTDSERRRRTLSPTFQRRVKMERNPRVIRKPIGGTREY